MKLFLFDEFAGVIDIGKPNQQALTNDARDQRLIEFGRVASPRDVVRSFVIIHLLLSL